MNTKRFLKSILTSSAIIAAASAPLYSASAIDTGQDDAQLSNNGHWDGGAAPANTQTAKFLHDNVIADAARADLRLDFNSRTGATLKWGGADVTVTAITGAHANKDAVLNAVGTAGALTVTATGNLNTKGVGTIDFGNQAATINLSPGDGNSADYSSVTFKSTGANNGTVNIGDGTVTLGKFTAAGNAVKNITVSGTAVAIASSDIVLAGGNGTLLADAAKLQINDGVKAGVVDGNGGANRGTIEFLGASTVDAELGANTAIKVIETKGAADKLVTATAAIDTKKLVLGAGGMTTSEDVTVGTDGVTGTGKLAFTANKALKVSGDYASEGVIEVGNATLRYDSFVDNKSVTSDFTATHANSKLNIQTSAGAARNLTLGGNVGTSDDKFELVTITGDNDKVVLAADKTIYATDLRFDHANAQLTLNAGSNIVGNIISNGGVEGTLVVKGNSGSADSTIAAATNLTSITFDSDGNGAAANSKLTLKAINGDNQLGTLNFDYATAADQGGLVLDLSGLTAAGQEANLKINSGVIGNAISVGTITFENNDIGGKAKIEATGGNVGASKDQRLDSIDNSGQRLTLLGTGGQRSFFVGSIAASEVTLNNVKLGVYNRDASSPNKFIVTAANSEILADSVISTSDDKTEIHFNTDHGLTLGKNVEHHGTITSNGNGFGTLTLAEANTLNLDSVGESGKSIAKIAIPNTASTHTITSSGDIYANTIEFAAGGAARTLNLTGNLKGSITAGAGDQGIVKLKGGDIDSGVGANGNAIHSVNLDTEGTVTIGKASAGKYAATNTVLEKDGTLLFTDKMALNEAAGGMGTVTTATNGEGTIEINSAYANNAGTPIGTTAKMLKEFRIGSDAVLTADGEIHAKNITTTENNKGTVDLSVVADLTGTSIGSSDKRMKQVTFTDDTIVDDVYSKDIKLTAAATAKRLDSTNAIIDNGAATLLDEGYISRYDGNGLVTTKGSAIIAGNLGGALTTAGASVDKVVEIRGDTVTGAVTGDASTIKLTKDTTFADTLTTTASTLDLNGKTLSVRAATTFNGDTVIKIGGSSDVTKASLRSDAGGATLAAGGTLSLDLSGAANAGDTLKIFTKLDGTTAVAIAGLNDGDTIALRNSKHIKSATYDGTNNVATLVKETDAKEIFGNSVMNAANSAEFARAFTKASADAGVTLSDNESAFFSEVLNSADPSEIVARQVPEHVGRVAEVNSAALGDAMNISNTRMSSTFASAPVGVAAGDAADRFGLWADVKAGTSEQKERKSEAGYKGSTYGAFVGVDTMLSDNATLGMAFGYSNQNMKHKDSKSGDKTKAGTLTFGAYGNYDFGNSFFAQGNVAVGQTSVDAKERRGAAGNYTTAKAKYDVLGYSAEARGGYRYKFDNSTITPTAGLRFSYFGDSSYTETAAGAKNLVVKGKSRSVLSAVAGLNLATALDMDGVDVNPEVHMNLAYDLTAPKQKATYNFQGGNLKFDYKGAKPAKFAYNFGASVMAKADNVEYGVGYDANIADKYLGHTGSVKVKVSF